MEHLIWRKSSHSDEKGGDCVELAQYAEAIAVRDSKDPEGPHLTFDRAAFAAWARQIQDR